MTTPAQVLFLTISLSALVLLGGCGDDGAVCEAGRQLECACGDDVSGFQICRADGSGYGACMCDGIDAGADSGVDAGDTSTDSGVLRDSGVLDAGPADTGTMCADEAGEPCHLCTSCALMTHPPECQDERRACGDSPDCNDFIRCAVFCGDDDTSVEGCRTDHPTGADLEAQWTLCRECSVCPLSCGPAGRG